MKFNRISTWFVVSLFVCCVASITQMASGQISKERLAELKNRYDWGSIYLSYGSIPDVIQLLDNEARMEKIRKDFNVSPPPSMAAFLSRYKSAGVKRSIILFQLNFAASTPVAGYLTSNDFHGNINRIPMSAQEVLAAANWMDLYLTHAEQWSRIVAAIDTGNLGIKGEWQAIGQASNDPFLSESRIGKLLIGFRKSQSNRTGMETLRTEDPQLYETIKQFNTSYDTMTTALFEQYRKKNIWIYDEPHQSPEPKPKGDEAHVPGTEGDGRPHNYPNRRLQGGGEAHVPSRGEDPAWVYEQGWKPQPVENSEELEYSMAMQAYEEYRKVVKPKP